jgi:hypothetical protein
MARTSHQKGGRAHHTRPPPAPRRAQRLITLADLIFDDDPNSADTRTWFDHMTPLLITSGGGGMELLSQFFALTPPRCCSKIGTPSDHVDVSLHAFNRM